MLLILLEGRFLSASGNDFMLISHKKNWKQVSRPTPQVFLGHCGDQADL